MKYIFTSDWHIRTDKPVCRTDDFMETQKKVVGFIYDLAEKEDATVIIGGDIFHKARPERAQEIEMFLLKMFRRAPTAFIGGNHDFLYHRAENAYKGSIGVLALAGFKNVWYYEYGKHASIDMFSFGKEVLGLEHYKLSCRHKIAVIHKYCDNKPIPDFIGDGIQARDLLKEMPYDIIVTGDNHHGFTYKEEDRTVINPGSITRQVANMKEYKPRVYVYDEDEGIIRTVYLPDTDLDAVDDTHLERIKERVGRIDKFVDQLVHSQDIDIDFDTNLKVYIDTNKVNKSVRNTIQDIIEGI